MTENKYDIETKHNIRAIDQNERLPKFRTGLDDPENEAKISNRLLFKTDNGTVITGYAMEFQPSGFVIFTAAEENNTDIYQLSQILCWYEI